MPHTHMLQVIRKAVHLHMRLEHQSSFLTSICGTSRNCHGHFRYRSQSLQQVCIAIPLGTPFAIAYSQEYKQYLKHSTYLSSWQVSECNWILHISKMNIHYNQLILLIVHWLIHSMTYSSNYYSKEAWSCITFTSFWTRTGWNGTC